MNRRHIVAGNWKMNQTYEEGRNLAKNIIAKIGHTKTEVILCPPYIHLKNINNTIKDVSNVSLGAQNCHQNPKGAFTGEISVSMLKSVGVEYVIIGHSERREYFNESNDQLAEKINIALEEGLKPIYCCGEKLEIRESGNHFQLVENQLNEGLFHLSEKAFQEVIIAYEPVWAIGTGVTASPDQAQEIHAFIRSLIEKKYGSEIAQTACILYGGSCKPGNAKELFGQKDVDGGLIGGASLKAEDFVSIINSFS